MFTTLPALFACCSRSAPLLRRNIRCATTRTPSTSGIDAPNQSSDTRYAWTPRTSRDSPWKCAFATSPTPSASRWSPTRVRRQHRTVGATDGRAVRPGALSRVCVLVSGRRLRRARAPQFGDARRPERGPGPGSEVAAGGDRPRVHPYVEPDAHPPRRIRGRGLSHPTAHARTVVERRLDDVLARTVADVCGCDVQPFFAAHVRDGRSIDFDRYLRLIGLRVRVSWKPALSSDSQPAADLRFFAWQPPGERALSLLLTDPTGAWARAGLHTGDRVVAVNGAPFPTMDDLRALRRIEAIPEATERQRVLRGQCVAGAP